MIGMGLVPDQAFPTVGWRVWDVVELDGALRLCSLAFFAIWVPRLEARAACRRSLVGPTPGPPHDAPQERCTCGIYATRRAAQVLEYARDVRRRTDTVHRVIGRVALWGTVVECEGGWRASHAYPSELVVPTARPRSLRPAGGLVRPSLPVEEIARRLADYGVPVELLDAASGRELARLLEPPSAPR